MDKFLFAGIARPLLHADDDHVVAQRIPLPLLEED
eukprot:CAMPEP_0198575032 /NCGR_PEP_ID=MMETSP1462-20131121/115579_1 /TAXON_ID=1333877 /ORGANISM="Brandtodinium nutriculum, Strain RCC3387" /LENGTH=34 /DNA_ID= /DNA_START= /DNA_END= /DNA_ORIENTATION=